MNIVVACYIIELFLAVYTKKKKIYDNLERTKKNKLIYYILMIFARNIKVFSSSFFLF